MKNKQTMFVVMRQSFDGNEVPVAVSDNPDKADDLRGEYEQMFIDRGYLAEEINFYVTATTYYV